MDLLIILALAVINMGSMYFILIRFEILKDPKDLLQEAVSGIPDPMPDKDKLIQFAISGYELREVINSSSTQLYAGRHKLLKEIASRLEDKLEKYS